jgi:hypothetical protein
MDPQVAEQSELRHEQSTIRLRPLLFFGAGLFLLAVVTFATMDLLFDYFANRQAQIDVLPSPLADLQQLPPEPRLQVTPGLDLQRMHEAEDAVLHSYHWVDRETGVVGIPIDRAIAILAEKGLPVRDEAKVER